MEKNYLEISKAGDIKNRKDRFLYRLFEVLPGALSLGTLFCVLVFSWLVPSWVAIFVICFCFYYLFRIFYFSLHQIAGYFKVKKYAKRDWLKEVKKLKGKNWKDIYHTIILPTYKEGPKIIKESLDALMNSSYPKEKMIVVLAVEERAGEGAKKMAKEIEKKYSSNFFKFLISVHPDNIAGEIGGKGSNVAWAGKEAKKAIDKLKISYENILFSTFDIDTKAYSQYFA